MFYSKHHVTLDTTHLLLCVTGFSLKHVKQALGSQPCRRIDEYHALLQVMRNVHRYAKTHLEDTMSIQGAIKVSAPDQIQPQSPSAR